MYLIFLFVCFSDVLSKSEVRVERVNKDIKMEQHSKIRYMIQVERQNKSIRLNIKVYVHIVNNCWNGKYITKNTNH